MDEQQVQAALSVLDKDVGTWDAAIVVRMGPTPQALKGTATSRRECGGRWLVTDFRAESGFNGHAIFGFDPAKERYTGVWVDNMRSFIAVAEGEWDAASRTMTMVTEAEVGGRRLRWRETTETVDAGTSVWRQLMPGPDGAEMETMTITYTRRS